MEYDPEIKKYKPHASIRMNLTGFIKHKKADIRDRDHTLYDSIYVNYPEKAKSEKESG
jgi:hypothetical protein